MRECKFWARTVPYTTGRERKAVWRQSKPRISRGMPFAFLECISSKHHTRAISRCLAPLLRRYRQVVLYISRGQVCGRWTQLFYHTFSRRATPLVSVQGAFRIAAIGIHMAAPKSSSLCVLVVYLKMPILRCRCSVAVLQRRYLAQPLNGYPTVCRAFFHGRHISYTAALRGIDFLLYALRVSLKSLLSPIFTLAACGACTSFIMKYTIPLLALTAGEAAAQFFVLYGRDTMVSRIDPILTPGAIGGHVHDFMGAGNANENSTFASLREASCSSMGRANGNPIIEDKSIYWHPSLYAKNNDGKYIRVPTNGHQIYYMYVFVATQRRTLLMLPQ